MSLEKSRKLVHNHLPKPSWVPHPFGPSVWVTAAVGQSEQSSGQLAPPTTHTHTVNTHTKKHTKDSYSKNAVITPRGGVSRIFKQEWDEMAKKSESEREIKKNKEEKWCAMTVIITPLYTPQHDEALTGNQHIIYYCYVPAGSQCPNSSS